MSLLIISYILDSSVSHTVLIPRSYVRSKLWIYHHNIYFFFFHDVLLHKIYVILRFICCTLERHWSLFHSLPTLARDEHITVYLYTHFCTFTCLNLLISSHFLSLFHTKSHWYMFACKYRLFVFFTLTHMLLLYQ